jgi:hypothetical protein
MTFHMSLCTVASSVAKVLALGFCFVVPCMFNSAHAMAEDLKYRCEGLAEKAKNTELGQSEYQGKDGWFFRGSDFIHLYPLTEYNLATLKKVKNLLALKKTDLVVLPVPPRALLAKDYLLPDGIFDDVIYDHAFAQSEFKKLISEFEKNDFEVVDILGFFEKHPELDQSKFFFLRDFHWSPQGASWTAQAIGDLLKGKLKLDDGENKNYETRDTGNPKILDSVVGLVLNQACNDKIPHEYVNIFETKDNSQTLDSFLADAAQQATPVVLLGTSFSSERQPFHFSGFLRSELKTEVANFALSGGGMDQAFFDWAHSDTWQKSPPKAVIWELPFIDRLPSFSEPSARQIVPALGGLCTGTLLSVEELPFENVNKLELKVSKPNVSGSKFYLSADLSDASMRAPVFRLTYDDGRQEEYSPHRPDRVPKVNKLFWELSDSFQGNLQNVEIEFEPNKIETGTLAICKYPDSVFQQTTN